MYSDYILFPGIREKTNNFFNSFFKKKKNSGWTYFLVRRIPDSDIRNIRLCPTHTHLLDTFKPRVPGMT